MGQKGSTWVVHVQGKLPNPIRSRQKSPLKSAKMSGGGGSFFCDFCPLFQYFSALSSIFGFQCIFYGISSMCLYYYRSLAVDGKDADRAIIDNIIDNILNELEANCEG